MFQNVCLYTNDMSFRKRSGKKHKGSKKKKKRSSSNSEDSSDSSDSDLDSEVDLDSAVWIEKESKLVYYSCLSWNNESLLCLMSVMTIRMLVGCT